MTGIYRLLTSDVIILNVGCSVEANFPATDSLRSQRTICQGVRCDVRCDVTLCSRHEEYCYIAGCDVITAADNIKDEFTTR